MIHKIKAFLKLIRWFHELVAILPFVGLYGTIEFFSQQSNSNCTPSVFNFAILCICVQLLIAAGCVLNDIVDRKIDKINKPKTHIIDNSISLKGAWIIFSTLTFIIILLSIYISVFVFSEWAFISSSVYILSLFYDFYFKRSPLMGNILMAVLTALIPLVILFFARECIEELNNEKIIVLIYLYATLPFLIIIPRELSLDISDIEGDKAIGCKTLPIVIGIKKSKLIVALFLILIIILSVPVAIRYSYLSVSMVIIDLLILIYLYKFRAVKTRLDYIKIGRFLWFIMILGLILFTISTII